MRDRECLDYQPGRLPKLLLIVTVRCHRGGNGVGGEQQGRAGVGTVFGDRSSCFGDEGIDEARMVVVRPDLVDLRNLGPRAPLGHGVASGAQVLPVLAAARVRGIRRGENSERTGDAIVGHLLDHIGKVRIPVAVAPVDPEWHSGCGECSFEFGPLATTLFVEWTYPTKVGVLLADLGESLAGCCVLP